MNAAMNIKQGDQYKIPISLAMDGGTIADEAVSVVEVYLNDTRKLLHPENGVVYYPLTQAETFALRASSYAMMDIRVKFVSGDVIGIPEKLKVSITDAVSEEVL